MLSRVHCITDESLMSEFIKADIPVERLSGSIERVTFHSEESGFCVLRTKVKGHRDLITVVGSAASVTPGEYIECLGTWFNDRTHGLQFKANHLTVVPPSTLEGIEKWHGEGNWPTFCEGTGECVQGRCFYHH